MCRTRPTLRFAASITIAALVMMILLCWPLAIADDYSDETQIQATHLRHDLDMVVSWVREPTPAFYNREIGVIDRIDVAILVHSYYVHVYYALATHTRVHAVIAQQGAPENQNVFSGYLNEFAEAPGYSAIPGTFYGIWSLTRKAGFPMHLISSAVYDLNITLEVFYNNAWVTMDTLAYTFEGSPPTPIVTPDYPDVSEPTTWLPLMMSFGIIVGMAFIGYNLSKSRDPIPGIFMLFIGVVMSWSIGWLPTWVFITAIALVAIVSATLWGKLFRRGG